MPLTPKTLRWHVLEDTGYDDCTLDSFAGKNEAVAFIKACLNDPEYDDETLILVDDKHHNEPETYYATETQIAAKRDRMATEKAQIRQSCDDEQRDRESGFHWTNGWFFKRMSDGSVRITKLDEYKNITIRASIPPPEWASIVCSTSKDGETAERWDKAQRFHGRE